MSCFGNLRELKKPVRKVKIAMMTRTKKKIEMEYREEEDA